MGKNLDKLLSIASEPISKGAPQLSERVELLAGPLAGELRDMLARLNGFYAFEAALRVLPDRSIGLEHGLAEWNDAELWIKDYLGAADGALFFAEDVFGHPFVIKDGSVFSFDPEFPSFEHVGDSLEEWAAALLADFDLLSGWRQASEWQKVNGHLTPGKRLAPKQPFFLGGEFEVENLYEGDPVEVMRFRAHMWQQLKDAEEGQEVVVQITD